MDTNKLGVMECLNKYDVSCCDEYVVELLDDGVFSCLDKNIKDYFDVYFLLTPPLEYIIEETLGRKCLFRHGDMQKIGWYDTYSPFCYHNNYKNQMIYQYHLNDGR